MSNLTSMPGLLLRKFSEVRELQLLHFFVFLAWYMTTMTGNLLIIAAVAFDHHLHTPMYFFLMNLAILDISSISVTVPKSMANSLMNSQSIAYFGCAAQVFFVLFFQTSDFVLLTIMAHDRNVAICNPLRYEAIMNKRACLQMVASAWTSGFLCAVLHTGSTFALSFCSNIVDQFFCEIPKLLKLSCSNLYLVEVGLLVASCSIVLGCFIFIIITYTQIFSAVLRMPSVQGQKKAISTCLPHLIVVSVFIFTGIFTYTSPPTNTSSKQDLVFAIIYTMVPPMMNPIIYSMRNKKIKVALWKLFRFKDIYRHACPKETRHTVAWLEGRHLMINK